MEEVSPVWLEKGFKLAEPFYKDLFAIQVKLQDCTVEELHKLVALESAIYNRINTIVNITSENK